MRRIVQWMPVVLVAGSVCACALPRASEIQPARTHIQTLRFAEPKDGLIDAKAKFDIYNTSQVETKIDEIHAVLLRGDVVVAKARRGGDHSIRAGHTAKVYVEFKDIPVARLEAAIGRKLVKDGIEKFAIEGVIVYESEDGPVRHPIERFAISTILGPKGSKM